MHEHVPVAVEEDVVARAAEGRASHLRRETLDRDLEVKDARMVASAQDDRRGDPDHPSIRIRRNIRV